MSLFTLADGRRSFYQWDVDRQLIVHDEACTEVHFFNGSDNRCPVCTVKTQDGLRLVDVPNILLQDTRSITAFAFVDESVTGGYTRRAVVFPVRARPKPDDYVYTETEILNYTTLKEELDRLKKNVFDVTAKPGQMIRVKSVDENGKPTAWEAVPWGWEETGMVELPVSGFWIAETLDNPSGFVVTAPLGLEIGKTYIVNWDGVEYSVVGKDLLEISDGLAAGVLLGNQYIFTGENEPGEPFIILAIDDPEANVEGVYGVVVPADGRSNTEFHIYGDGEVVHKLPNKFLDLDWLPTLEENAIIPEYTGVAQPDGDRAIMIIPYGGSAVFSAEPGTELMMYVNGVGYPAIKTRDPDGDYVETVDKKYLIAAWAFSESSFFIAADAGTYTVKVTTGGGNKNRLPDEFIPESLAELPPKVKALEENLEGQVAEAVSEYLKENPPSGGVQFETDDTLTLKNGILSVNTTDQVIEDDTRLITSGAVYNEFSKALALLKTI